MKIKNWLLLVAPLEEKKEVVTKAGLILSSQKLHDNFPTKGEVIIAGESGENSIVKKGDRVYYKSDAIITKVDGNHLVGIDSAVLISSM